MRIVNNVDIVRRFPRRSTRGVKEKFGFKPISVIEVGVCIGENARSMFQELNIGKMYLVDPYKEFFLNEPEILVTQEQQNKFKAEMKKRLKKYWDRIVFLEMPSSQAAKHINEKVDYIYIDGDHSYKAVKEDLQNYYPLLKKGGLLMGDDCNKFAVSKAVLQFCVDNNLVPTSFHKEFVLHRNGKTKWILEK